MRVRSLLMNGKAAQHAKVPILAVLAVLPLADAAPARVTLEAWQRYAAEVEARLNRTRSDARPITDALVANGESVAVPSGTISHWRGSVFVRGVTLDRLLAGLMQPGTPPPQVDVVASRVLARDGQSLRVYVRLVRHAIVTATYDTEHVMTFTRQTRTLATARSVATRIEELGGGDRGFLWRLQSYWRYEERLGGVLVELESLTLSRSIPAVVRPVAMPFVTQVARESMSRTLQALKRFFEE